MGVDKCTISSIAQEINGSSGSGLKESGSYKYPEMEQCVAGVVRQASIYPWAYTDMF